MPELPEVEVVKRSLDNKVKNLIVRNVKINDGRLRFLITEKKLKKIIGLKIKKIKRRSKFLLFFFNKETTMLVHLGMTGKFFFENKQKKTFKTSFYYKMNQEKDTKYNRVIFYLNKNQKLIYNDVRKFGFIKILKNENINLNSHLINLGPEPFEKSFNSEYFKKYIQNRNRDIKNVLMDQKFISGIGNIYANEILFLSRLKPSRKAKLIKLYEVKRIIKFTKSILSRSIKQGGSSIKDFSSSNKKKGSFQQYFNVYGKKGKICPSVNCKNKIIKIMISNRAAFYCSKCQK